ncbi:MAG: peptidoglycan DD-metalloendopeptidase family protein [Ferruginibacter sp.]|nr:peptidoglycan DD-metalloendopeptidase family protein [Ferruginibacter sp.]
MLRVIFLFVFCFTTIHTLFAQSREDLEKQRSSLKKEIDETQKLLTNNKAETNKNLTTLIILGNKANLQERVVENISKDINILDNNIYGIQRDINKYDRILDTLKQEYAKSMVYAYKNRGNYEFLNFIFSADNFNDAIKRIAYLKSYRTFREMQGQNILRTQELRRKKLEDLGVTKKIKNSSLTTQTEEQKKVEEQKLEQDKIVASLKKEGKDLNARIAEKQRQVAKVNAAVKAAIAKAIREEKERERLVALAAKKKRDEERAAEAKKERERKAAEDKANRDKRAAAIAAGKTPLPDVIKPTTTKVIKEPKEAEPVILSSESIALNSSFEKNKGSLPWPVDNPRVLNHFGRNSLPSGASMNVDCVTIAAPVGTNVKAVFDGSVTMSVEIDEGKFTVLIKHGNYFTTYSNINNVMVKQGQVIKTGQALGKVATNLDGVGTIDFYTSKGDVNFNPESWLRRH